MFLSTDVVINLRGPKIWVVASLHGPQNGLYKHLEASSGFGNKLEVAS